MFTTIAQFKEYWARESDKTRKIMHELTDRSLGQKITAENRTLGRLAWHIAQSIPEMAGRTGLNVDGPAENAAVPAKADDIKKAYDIAASSLLDQVGKNWDDKSLLTEDDMYGEKWKRCDTLMALILHEVHHRAQMTILMRQAGLNVPGVYGPSLGEWAHIGMKPPEI